VLGLTEEGASEQFVDTRESKKLFVGYASLGEIQLLQVGQR
jgi:hypothetical protein